MDKLIRLNAPACFLVFLVLSCSAAADSVDHGRDRTEALTAEQQDALGASQGAIGNLADDYVFTDHDGQPVNFSGYLGKPLLVNFIFTSCHHTCPMMTTNLSRVVDVAREALGAEAFAVVTVGFDVANDTPDRMRMFAVQRGVKFEGWDFLSGDTEAIDNISRDLGFSFRPSPAGFDHLAQTTILDSEGRIYRQVYGQNFDPPVLVEPLKELIFGQQREAGKIDEWINGIRLFCTVYDPSSGRYYFDYSLFISIGIGILCLFSIAFFVVRAWREHGTGASAQ